MAISYVDTKRLKEISKNVILLSNRYDVLINELFKTFSLIPFETKEWVGQSSQKYFRIVSFDKIDFIKFGEHIREYGKRISNDAELIEDKIYSNVLIEKK